MTKHLTCRPAPVEPAVSAAEYICREDVPDVYGPILGVLGLTAEQVLVHGVWFTGHDVEVLALVPVEGVEPIDHEGIWVWPVSVPIFSDAEVAAL